MDVKIQGVPRQHIQWALQCAFEFFDRNPEWRGSQHGCMYQRGDEENACVWVYQTAGGCLTARWNQR